MQNRPNLIGFNIRLTLKKLFALFPSLLRNFGGILDADYLNLVVSMLLFYYRKNGRSDGCTYDGRLLYAIGGVRSVLQ